MNAKKIMPLVLAAVMLLCGCNSNDGPQPASNMPGYYAAQQVVSGGQDIYGLNLSDLEIRQDAGDTVLVFNFMNGSLQLGMEESAAGGVPLYSVEHVGGLNRLVLTVRGLIFWDYRVYKDELAETAISGLLQEVPINTEDTRLYINVRDDYVYRISEQDNKLELRIRPTNMADDTKWYAVLNAFNEYSDGMIYNHSGDQAAAPDIGMRPTLCNDGVSGVLISPAFDTMEDAQAFAKTVDDALQRMAVADDDDMGKALKAKRASVVKLQYSQLPDYSEQGVMDALVSTPVALKDEELLSMPALVGQGRLLCYTPDSTAYVFSRPFFLTDEDGRVSAYEKLYMGDVAEGVPQQLLEFEFNSVGAARFSPGGDYLAFVDQTSMQRSLYIWDIQRQQLVAAAEEGMGDDTAAFVWAPSGQRLYAVTGELDTLSLRQLDIAADGSMESAALGDALLTAGDMDIQGDTIILSQSGGELDEGIYTVKTSTGEISRLCDGYVFSLNKRSGELLVMADSEGGGSLLKRVGLPGGEETVISSGLAYGEAVWDADGVRVYYVAYEGDNDDYPMRLYVYEGGESSAKMQLALGQLLSSSEGGRFLLVRVYSQSEQFIPVTYSVALG